MNIVADSTGLVTMWSDTGIPDPPVGGRTVTLDANQLAVFQGLIATPNGGIMLNGNALSALPFVPPIVLDPADSGNLPKAMKALLLVMATWSGKTPVQAKAAFLAAWNALP